MRLTIPGLVTTILLIFNFAAFAQARRDTVRDNVNYRLGYSSFQAVEKLTGNYHYLGLQANQLLRQLLGSAGGGDNPFTLTYAFNSATTGKGMSFGLGLSTRNIKDHDAATNLTRNTKSSNLAFRVGYDVKKSIGKRWIAGYAFDALRDGDKSETTTSFGGGGGNTVTTTKTNGFGVGFRLSLLFNVNERIYLGTESGLTFMAKKTTSKTTNQSLPNSAENELKDNTFALGVPSTLFLVVRF